jgi:flagellar basal-body rod protein FlgC
MGYFSSFDISASGMAIQKTIVDTVALNLANTQTTRTVAGGPYQPKTVIVSERVESNRFEGLLAGYSNQLNGAEVINILPSVVAPRMVHDPAHPDADKDGMVAFPNINPVSEMVNLMQSTRAYEANVRALNAAKTMALRALGIGGR